MKGGAVTLVLALASLIAGRPAAAELAVGQRVQWPASIALFDGRTLARGDLAGKVVVVEYWASWCPFCNRMNLSVQQLHERAAGRGLVVLALSVDKSERDARDYYRRKGNTFPAAMHTPELERVLPKPRGLPVVVVVDRGGKVTRIEKGEMFDEDILDLARLVD